MISSFTILCPAGSSAIGFGVLVLFPFVAMTLVSVPYLNLQWLSFPAPISIDWRKALAVLLWNVSG